MNVVVLKEGDWWIAQGLEHDIVAQGETVEAAILNFPTEVARHFAVRMRSKQGVWDQVSQAEPKYWKLFAHAALRIDFRKMLLYTTFLTLPSGKVEERIPLPHFEIRVAREA